MCAEMKGSGLGEEQCCCVTEAGMSPPLLQGPLFSLRQAQKNSAATASYWEERVQKDTGWDITVSSTTKVLDELQWEATQQSGNKSRREQNHLESPPCSTLPCEIHPRGILAFESPTLISRTSSFDIPFLTRHPVEVSREAHYPVLLQSMKFTVM